MSERFRPEQKIKSEKQFLKIIRNGKFAKGKLLQMWLYPSETGETSCKTKIGIIVSRKVDLRATRRNLWKRRIRESFRRNQNAAGENLLLVVRAQKQEKIPSYQNIEKEFLSLLKKIRS